MDESSVHPAPTPGFEGKITICARRPDDIAACVRVLADVHAADGYPMYWPADPFTWLAPEHLLAAWVAQGEQAVLGHVALCRAVGDSAAPVWSAAAGLPPERIAAVAKLFVAPSARGRGVGAALLATASAEADARGLRPALEVLDHDGDAIALYECAGWCRVASAPAPWALASGSQMLLRYYLAPVDPHEVLAGTGASGRVENGHG